LPSAFPLEQGEGYQSLMTKATFSFVHFMTTLRWTGAWLWGV